jgi:hypothetical protein
VSNSTKQLVSHSNTLTHSLTHSLHHCSLFLLPQGMHAQQLETTPTVNTYRQNTLLQPLHPPTRFLQCYCIYPIPTTLPQRPFPTPSLTNQKTSETFLPLLSTSRLKHPHPLQAWKPVLIRISLPFFTRTIFFNTVAAKCNG